MTSPDEHRHSPATPLSGSAKCLPIGFPVAEDWDFVPPSVLLLTSECGLVVKVAKEAKEAPEPGLALVRVVVSVLGLAVEPLFVELVGLASPTTTPVATTSATVYVHCLVPE